MAVTVENGRYVIEIPEQSLRQEFNPDVSPPRPFLNEGEALAWQAAFLQSIETARANAEAAHHAAEQARLAAIVTVHVDIPHDSVAVGTPLNVTATLKNGLDQVVPITRAFDVPIENDFGIAAKIKRVEFVDGVATASITFDRSGYYRITEKGINARIDPALRMKLAGGMVEVAAFE